MITQVAKNHILPIGNWKTNANTFIIFDLSHINSALKQHKTKAIQGIIGADVLQNGNAIIDYTNRYLCLK